MKGIKVLIRVAGFVFFALAIVIQSTIIIAISIVLIVIRIMLIVFEIFKSRLEDEGEELQR